MLHASAKGLPLPRNTLLLSLAAAAFALGAAALGAGCAGAVTPDSQPDTGSLVDASADAEADAGPDAKPSYDGAIGRACGQDSDCGAGHRCQITAPDGYCVMDCSPDKTCPEGTLCSPVPLSRISGVCMLACSNQNQCRPGYVCDVVHLFPDDPNAPKSPGPVCWEPWPKDGGP
jgi:hypothetical protein